MRLSRVEIRGFKTIAKKTVLTFPGPVTCIAGPNGCGKSNVIDAIRWALGEQSARAIRAGSMMDVIFAGTSDIPQSSMASVTLEFVKDGVGFPASMDGFDAISVSRRLFRSGESIYELNNVRCRLKDITDIFLDSGLDRQGYAIIEQGRVKDIILARPEDIRHVIEEAAEVGRFRVKRVEAMKRLETTSGNLERIKDIIAEVAKQRDSLKAQASKARRYQALKDRMNELTMMLWAGEIQDVQKRQQEFNEQLSGVEKEIETAKREGTKEASLVEERLKKLNEMKALIDAVNFGLSDAKARHALAIAERDASIERMKDIQSSLLHLNAKIETACSESQSSDIEIKKAAESKARLENEETQIEEALKLSAEGLDSLSQEMTSISSGYDKKRSELFEKLGSSRLVEQRINYLKQRLNETSSGIKKRFEELEILKSEIDSSNAEITKLDKAIGMMEKQIGSGNEQMIRLSLKRDDLLGIMDENQKILAAKEKEHAGLLARIEMLMRIAGGSPQTAGKSERTSFKKLADVIRVKAGYEEAAGSFGDMLDYLVINDHDELLEDDALPSSAPGYILSNPHSDKVKAGDIPQDEAVISPFKKVVSPAKGFDAIVEYLARGRCVVRDIKSAVMLWKKGERSQDYITLDGMVLEKSGVLRVNAEKDKYAEMLRAKAELEVQEARETALENEITGLKEGLIKDAGRLESIKNELLDSSEGISKAEKEKLAVLSQRQAFVSKKDVAERRHQDFSKEVKSWEEMTAGIKDEISSAQTEKESTEILLETLKSGLKLLETKKAEIASIFERSQEEKRAVEERLGSVRVEKAAVLERLKGLETQVLRVQDELESDRLRVEEIKVKEKEITSMMENAEEVVINSLADIRAKEDELEKMKPEYEKSSLEAEKICEREHSIKDGLAQLEDKKNMFLLESKEQEIAERMMLERYEGRFGKDSLPEIPQEFDIGASREEVAKLQTRVDALGQINFAAIESYDDAQTRHDELHAEYQDLVLASERLKELISSIEKESQKEFNATFAKVRANFQEIFATVFGGGQADIVLQDGGMDAGVEIYACPPFKKLKVMSLLSEGEKTMTAISFIFALFKVRPSPFCILDEVDAPLDDVNLERINRLIRTFSKESQFVIVTHNKNTMEMADIIYGVTFEVPGITKLVSMDLQKV